MAERLADTRRFYELLDRLEIRVGGTRRLAECTGRMDWPQRGLYFFYEAGEERWDSGKKSRVVRIGTHGLNAGSRSTLWGRLSQHRGTSRGTGNHRGSIFRLLVGIALARQSGVDPPPSWGVGADPGAAARRLGVERARVKSAEARPRDPVATSATCRSYGLTSATNRAPRASADTSSATRSLCSAAIANGHLIRPHPAGSGMAATGNGSAARACGTTTMSTRTATRRFSMSLHDG